jgi:elongation factor P
MATTSDFKNGLCIQLNNDLYLIVEFQHVKPGKGGAFVRTKLKSLTTGKVIDKTFNAGVKIDTTGYHFMDNASFEQLTLGAPLINAPQLLKEGQEVAIIFHQETAKPLSCELPPFVALKVTYTEPGFKGDTATKTFKPATLETGVQIQVPLFIDNEDMLKIDTRTSTYAERIKK